jgi:hypothetical protein
MTRDVRITVGTTGVLLLVAGVLVLVLPGVNVMPWALLFFAVGAGLCTGAGVSANAEVARRTNSRVE